MYSLAPEKYNFTFDDLSPYCKKTLNIKNNVAKLVPNQHNKKNYVLHVENLKFYLSLAFKPGKIHRGFRARLIIISERLCQL